MSDEPQSHDEWAKSFRVDQSLWLSEPELQLMYEATCRYGSGNCWTGTIGTLAMQMRQLLEERLRLIAVVQQIEEEANNE